MMMMTTTTMMIDFIAIIGNSNFFQLSVPSFRNIKIGVRYLNVMHVGCELMRAKMMLWSENAWVNYR